MSDTKISIDWQKQVGIIVDRFAAALRQGQTVGSLDHWVGEVPESFQARLRGELEQCQASHRRDELGHAKQAHANQAHERLGEESISTRAMASDVVTGWDLLSEDEVAAGKQVAGDALPECQTFQGLSSSAREAMELRFERRSFAAGTQILRQGQSSRGLHFIQQGRVEIVDSETGQTIDFDGKGSVMGEMSLLMDQPCSADVLAVNDVEALVLSAVAYQELKGRHPELEIALSQLVSDRLGGRHHDALCGKVMGGYRIMRCINRGGMAVVYEAETIESGERVALKMLRHRFIYDEQMQNQFAQEARLLTGLVHPNVVSLRETFLACRTRFLVLDLCNGCDLHQLIVARSPLEESTVRAIVGQIASGLLCAHRAGVIHRDLKPGNVLVDLDGQVRLTDFGLSKLLGSEIGNRRAVGTPSYMPPEQFLTDQVGPECDWYALGCLIYEMMTARRLFSTGKWMHLFEKKRGSVPGDDWPNVDASGELIEVLRGCLQPDAARRRLDLESLADWATKVDCLFARPSNPSTENGGEAKT